jgi:hypothetical protein
MLDGAQEHINNIPGTILDHLKVWAIQTHTPQKGRLGNTSNHHQVMIFLKILTVFFIKGFLNGFTDSERKLVSQIKLMLVQGANFAWLSAISVEGKKGQFCFSAVYTGKLVIN